jgi:hypothetical protein
MGLIPESHAKRHRHQKTALAFMMQREDGPIPEKYALWKATEEEGVQWSVRGKQAGLVLLI